MVQLGVWLLGEFGEMLANPSAVHTGAGEVPAAVPEDEIGEILARILSDHARKGERSDTIICWVLTALSKLTIRLKTIQAQAKELIKSCADHMNVEIQQRACEYLQLFDKKWDDERHGIFEPIPIKGDLLEGKGLYFDSGAQERPDFDEEGEAGEGDQPESISPSRQQAAKPVKPAEVA